MIYPEVAFSQLIFHNSVHLYTLNEFWVDVDSVGDGRGESLFCVIHFCVALKYEFWLIWCECLFHLNMHLLSCVFLLNRNIWNNNYLLNTLFIEQQQMKVDHLLAHQLWGNIPEMFLIGPFWCTWNLSHSCNSSYFIVRVDSSKGITCEGTVVSLCCTISLLWIN